MRALLFASLLTALAAPLAAPPLPARAPEAGYDARAPWVAAPRQPNVSQERFVGMLRALRGERPRLLFVGDSLIENWLTLGSAVWEKDYVPRGAADLGFGGDRTENTLWRIERGELDGIAPDVTVIEIGTNDLDRWSVPEVATGIVTVVDAVRAKLPETRIIVLGIFPREGTPIAPLRARARAVNAIVSERNLGPGVRYEDIGGVLLESNGTFLPGVMEDRRLHPSLTGYELLSGQLDRFL